MSNAPIPTENPGGSVPAIRLPSGTTVDVRTDPTGESITVRSAAGTIDLTIRITDQGPVLSLKGIRLEIEAADAVAVNCREFAVTASEGMRLTSGADLAIASGAEIRMKSAGSTFVDADVVNLNCLDRTGYHDHVPEGGAESLDEGDAPPEAR
jgi:hypothetical protein